MSVAGRLSRGLMAPANVGISDRFFGLRDRLLGSLNFQRWAAAIPFTRPIAKKRAREVFDLCAGFVYSQILQACVRLKVFEHLRDGPMSLEALAAQMDLSVDAARRLLDGAVALKLVDKRGANRYALGPHGAVIVGNPGIMQMIEHHAMLYADLADPVALLRGDVKELALAKYWAYARSDQPDALADQRIAGYTGLMSASQTLVAQEILDVYPVARHKRLLDVGGGDGTFLRAVAARAPNLDLRLFDLPSVAARANARFDAEGLSHRARAIGGDFFNDPLPDGADLISLVRIIHDHDDEPVRVLLRAIRAALAPGGVLLIAEPMSGASGAEPVGDAYFGFYLLAMGSGRPRTAAEITQMLKSEGFSRVRAVPTHMPLQTSVLIASQ
jgi:demethylspheroidene O-methyltransferase